MLKLSDAGGLNSKFVTGHNAPDVCLGESESVLISCEFVSNLVNRGGDGDDMTTTTMTRTATSSTKR